MVKVTKHGRRNKKNILNSLLRGRITGFTTLEKVAHSMSRRMSEHADKKCISCVRYIILTCNMGIPMSCLATVLSLFYNKDDNPYY